MYCRTLLLEQNVTTVLQMLICKQRGNIVFAQPIATPVLLLCIEYPILQFK